MKTGRDEPLVMRFFGDVEVRTVVCEVSKNDTDVNSTLLLVRNGADQVGKLGLTVKRQEQRPRIAGGAISAI
jgi:hypothetical protein